MNTSLPFVSNETSSWLLYILTDSALPTGGFVASSGLEATYQAGLLTADNLSDFVTTSAHSYAWQTNGFVRAGWEAPDDANPISQLEESDSICDAVMVANTVARRASLAQGVAMLTLYLKCFTKNATPDGVKVVKSWKNKIRAGQTDGHFSVCFGLICRYLDVDLENTLHLWLYLFTRSLYSSAVRLNIIGPYEAQRLLLDSRGSVEKIVKKTKDVTVDNCCQTNPLLDVCQGMHDRLYSRLFNS
ncbi:hypothetical protein J3Q64DRAFT_1634757 [Phycomyces blakesleeanus]|uniref:Urease accessory protein UreF n=2 Tax=Phycomyces blakesleeanus TaxID=4837 RepID=A0A163ER65_PHYB8|nr:hypothetical protein PHYBLDRAFT_161623 [Phycomyces blakesleeanus NRRL 1555(-)]OAD80990.1 hypothetical protein PHYBLDRAFT_161623 [Phycomyces blakesleeanus NRRL 1555(-)]|eukprot:XP_018299030.1 hypothetical protein PHYBLDRAFT_161623 [Phycomyces blakesleeanus NRRL 1555(-)]